MVSKGSALGCTYSRVQVDDQPVSGTLPVTVVVAAGVGIILRIFTLTIKCKSTKVTCAIQPNSLLHICST